MIAWYVIPFPRHIAVHQCWNGVLLLACRGRSLGWVTWKVGLWQVTQGTTKRGGVVRFYTLTGVIELPICEGSNKANLWYF